MPLRPRGYDPHAEILGNPIYCEDCDREITEADCEEAGLEPLCPACFEERRDRARQESETDEDR